jgi:hypothetical protein
MDETINALRAALAPDATPELRAAGAQACRTMLTTLEPQPPATAVAAPVPTPPNIATIVTALRGAPPEQLLDLAIAKLRSALPAGSEVPAASPLKFNFVPVTRKVRP